MISRYVLEVRSRKPELALQVCTVQIEGDTPYPRNLVTGALLGACESSTNRLTSNRDPLRLNLVISHYVVEV